MAAWTSAMEEQRHVRGGVGKPSSLRRSRSSDCERGARSQPSKTPMPYSTADRGRRATARGSRSLSDPAAALRGFLKGSSPAASCSATSLAKPLFVM